ncbi:hypothetical protein BURKHO8Y_70095 [Burkholderia sp. 8Y]|nr:hypothetical protein BURKHO8Y_70095 [Burkholderia sp. 8Y]
MYVHRSCLSERERARAYTDQVIGDSADRRMNRKAASLTVEPECDSPGASHPLSKIAVVARESQKNL